jgi:hypothetical protein
MIPSSELLCRASVVFVTLLSVCAACTNGDAPAETTRPNRAESSQPANSSRDKAATPQAVAGDDVAATPSDQYDLSAQQVREYRDSALRGKADAASVLVEYYNLRREWLEAEIWVQIGAENGDLSSMFWLALSLQSGGGRDNCERARFWLKRSLQINARELALPDLSSKDRASVEGYAEMLTREISELESNNKSCGWSVGG